MQGVARGKGVPPRGRVLSGYKGDETLGDWRDGHDVL